MAATGIAVSGLAIVTWDGATPVASRTEFPTTSAPETTTTSTSSSTTTPAKSCGDAKHTPGRPDGQGGCWPGAGNTGVPAGISLTPYSGPCTITKANTVIEAKAINCELSIKASGVVVRRSLIKGTISTDEDSKGYSFSITDSTVEVGPKQGTGIGAVNFTATRVHVTGGNRSIHCWHDCTITDSYVHGQYRDATGKNHESGIRMGQSATIRHNSILCDAPEVPPDAGCSADLTGYGDFGPVRNNTIDHNLFVPSTGGYCAYGGSTKGKPYSGQTDHIKFTNNVFMYGTKAGDHGKPVCGYYGPITSFDTTLPGNVWTNNTWVDGTVVDAEN